MEKTRLGYPKVLFFSLLLSKIIYIVVESFYNYDVLNTTTDALLSQTDIERLNELGHRISSVGITLLLVPLFYYIFKRFNKKVIYTGVSLLFVLSLFGIYHGLNRLVDFVVEVEKEKRHDAYYLNLFKYGILNNVFVYNSFIDNKEIKNHSLKTESKIVLTNTFLALYADKELIEKLKQRGKEKAAEIYIQKHSKGKFEKDYAKFKQFAKKISNSWEEFNKAREKLKLTVSKLNDEQKIKKSYKDMQKRLIEGYKSYRLAYANLSQRFIDETSLEKLSKIKPDLERFFRYRRYKRAKQKYREKMLKSFGHYVEPECWLDKNSKVTYNSITDCIKKEIYNGVREKFGVQEGLSTKEFFYSDSIKIKVAKELKKHGILIPYDFDYSYKEFKKYYLIATSKKKKELYDEFYRKLERKIGKNDLKLSTDWKSFIYSRYLYNQIAKKGYIKEKKEIKKIQDIIFSKKLGRFRDEIYLPRVIKEVDKIMYKKEDFYNDTKVAKTGDDSIKLLYIPPLALSLSIIALLLNIITVFGMILKLFPIKPIVVTILKVALSVIILVIPLLSSEGSIKNKMLEKAMTKDMGAYIKFLGWISYWEKLNVKLHEKIK